MTFFDTVAQLFQHNPDALKPITWLDAVMHFTKEMICLGGTLIIFAGTCLALVRYVRSRAYKRLDSEFNSIRLNLGQTILLGLEFIVAADVIETTIAPDYYALGILIIVVAIRMILSVSLSKEIELDRVSQSGGSL